MLSKKQVWLQFVKFLALDVLLVGKKTYQNMSHTIAWLADITMLKTSSDSKTLLIVCLLEYISFGFQ